LIATLKTRLRRRDLSRSVIWEACCNIRDMAIIAATHPNDREHARRFLRELALHLVALDLILERDQHEANCQPRPADALPETDLEAFFRLNPPSQDGWLPAFARYAVERTNQEAQRGGGEEVTVFPQPDRAREEKYLPAVRKAIRVRDVDGLTAHLVKWFNAGNGWWKRF
jgi:hypothetical protein